MDEKRFCKFCGAHLSEGAKFCTNCGTDLVRQPTQREPELHGPIPLLSPQLLWPYIQSLWRRFWATSATKQPYKIIAGAVVGILILMVLAAAAPTSSTVNQDSAVPSATVPSATPIMKVTPTPSATVKLTATPTPVPKPVDYSAQITETYAAHIITPFYKTTMNGKEAYVGDVSEDGVLTHYILYPTKTITDAINYKERLIQSYKAQGYTTYKTEEDMWFGRLGLNVHGIGAMDTRWGFPATSDMSAYAS